MDCKRSCRMAGLQEEKQHENLCSAQWKPQSPDQQHARTDEVRNHKNTDKMATVIHWYKSCKCILS